MKILFLHFPKTAGTAIRNAIVRNNPSLRVLPAVDMPQLSRFSVEELAGYDFFAGHFDWSYFDVLGPDFFAFTLLREPRERVLSHYFYLRTLPPIHGEAFTPENFPGLFDVATKTPREALLTADALHRYTARDNFDNLYAHFFFSRSFQGARLARRAGASPGQVLRIARSNMGRFPFVGSFGRLDEDLAEIERLTGLRFRHDLKRENVTESVPPFQREAALKAMDGGEEALKLFRDFTALDAVLYEDVSCRPRADVKLPAPWPDRRAAAESVRRSGGCRADGSEQQGTAGLSGRQPSILILNHDLPVFPGGGGVEFLTTRELGRLAERVGLVSMVHSRRDLQRVETLEEAGVRLFLWKSPHLDDPPVAGSGTPPWRRAAAGLYKALRAWPRRPAETLDLDPAFRNMSASLVRALGERPWQVVSVIQSSSAAFLDYIPNPLVSVLVLHDIRAVLYDRRSQAAHGPLERWRWHRLARRYHAFEKRYCNRYDLVTTVSKHDAEWVRREYGARRVVTVPLPVDASYFVPAPEREVPGRIVFTGMLDHPPNTDAAIYYSREVFPAVRAQLPEAELHIVGKRPLPEVRALEALEGVRVTADIDDIRPTLASCSVFVVPLRYGAGARQKILEAWCMERCVVSTSIGAEGLEFTDGVNIAIADGTQALADATIRALRDPDWRNGLRRGGREIAVTLHDPRRVAEDYWSEIRSTVGEKACHDEPMRVLLDFRWMLPGRAGGIENLARSFFHELLVFDRCNLYTALMPAESRHDFDLRHHPNVRVLSPDGMPGAGRRVIRRVSGRIRRRLGLDNWRTGEVPNLLRARSLNAEVAYSVPGYIHPDLHSLRHVLVVPDIQHEYLPEFFPDGALEERQRLYGDAVQRADHICAISEFTRRTLIERLGVDPGRVTTVPLAAGPVFGPAPADDPGRLARYGLRQGTYFFLPAHTWRHKNHRVAIEALRILHGRHGLKPLLVCSGEAREAQPELEALTASSGLSEQVRFLGYRSEDDIAALYRGAIALVFPSLFEGFGMPVLEAMTCGCPVVCSNSSSLPEISGDAALLCDPRDAESLAELLRRVQGEKELRDDLRNRGFQRAAEYSWQKFTRQTVQIFRRVHDAIRLKPECAA
jgi:glycosyltransferase involved in cell wall biosynthesis